MSQHKRFLPLVVLSLVAMMLAACVPPDIGPILIGCTSVQGTYTVYTPGLAPEAIEVRDNAGSVLGSALVATQPGGTTYTVTIPLNPPQPEGTVLSVVQVSTSAVLASGPCSGALATPVPSFFNPGDGRVDPRPGDRLAIYCNRPAGSVDVWGVDDKSKGFRLATFTFDDLAAAGLSGLYVTAEPNGTISLSMDEQGNLWAAWNGGQYGAEGQPGHGFAKGFRCN
ncbi:MAG: hypothetical protein IT323_04790 [Anaerolineae bacterium]|nr:hypothetical protein [Anaerolineae bacterium]